MTFQYLAPNLHATALAAKTYFTKQHGATHFLAEKGIAEGDFDFRPTLTARLSDGYMLCVEVSERAFSNTLDSFVVECIAQSFPAKLYVALPNANGDPDYASNLRKAKSRGIGVLELTGRKPFVATEPVSLSLFGLRRNEMGQFPKNKRDAISQAEQTFLNGNPVKGCQTMYEILESLTRAFAVYSKNNGWWRVPHPGEKRSRVNLATGAWATVLKDLATFLDLDICRNTAPLISHGLIGGAQGVTQPRNLTSHRPTLKAIMDRDRKLKTWLESASELLKSWCDATKPLKLAST